MFINCRSFKSSKEEDANYIYYRNRTQTEHNKQASPASLCEQSTTRNITIYYVSGRKSCLFIFEMILWIIKDGDEKNAYQYSYLDLHQQHYVTRTVYS